jgi:DNA-binding response OmpR family regulator
MGVCFKILVVEDDPATQEALKRALSRLGCEVFLVDTAEKGIEELKKNRYDAVFAALCVREKGARSIARWVKSNSQQTRFFALTSWKGELESNLLNMDGIHDVIRKPLIFTEIRDKLLEYLG